MKKTIIYTDVGSCDPDDLLALMLLKHVETEILGIITTHHYPDKRAKLAKLLLNDIGLNNVPVYIGSGVKANEEYNEMQRETFDENNELWPSSFGYPHGVKSHEDKLWFPNFMKAYEDVYTLEELDSLDIETESGHNFMMNLLTSCKDKITVICMSPPHDLALLPHELYKKMDIWIMGGGFENYSCIANMCDKVDNSKIGYNS